MNEENDECSICGVDFKGKYKHQLPCNHIFHYECLLKTFISSKQTTLKYCPYCRKKCGHLPIVNGLKKLEIGIHVSSIEEMSYANGMSKIQNVFCKATLQKGKNKGNTCNKHCLLGFEYCGLHKKYIQEI